jgi:hypothetical protein
MGCHSGIFQLNIAEKVSIDCFFPTHTLHADSAQLSKVTGIPKMHIQCMDLSLWDDLVVYINIFMTNLIKKWLGVPL